MGYGSSSSTFLYVRGNHSCIIERQFYLYIYSLQYLSLKKKKTTKEPLQNRKMHAYLKQNFGSYKMTSQKIIKIKQCVLTPSLDELQNSATESKRRRN